MNAAAQYPELDDALYPPRLDRMALQESADGGLGAGPSYSEMLESICGGTDDSQPVEQYNGTLGVTAAFVARHQSMAVQVQWRNDIATRYTNPGNVSGARYGSGVMIGADLLLTCGHLFDQAPSGGWTVPRQNGTNNAITPQQIAQEMQVNFGYQVDASGTLRSEQSFLITSLIEYRLGGIDMALCRVAGSPGITFGWEEVSTVDAAVGDVLAIIGHPAGQPKRIEAGPTTSVSGGTITYGDIDTLGGNSGSGILQASTGRIVGIHTNGGCTSSGGANLGQAIAAVRAVSPTLQALPASSRTARADDGFATRYALDAGTTIRAADVFDTSFSRDALQTRLAADVATWRASDVGTVSARDTGIRDTIGTSLSRDIGGLGTRFGRDIDLGPVDPDLTTVEGVVDPGRIGVDWGRQRVRPFVQAGAYGRRFEAAEEPEETEEGPGLLDAVIMDLDEQIEAQTAALERLQALRDALAEQ